VLDKLQLEFVGGLVLSHLVVLILEGCVDALFEQELEQILLLVLDCNVECRAPLGRAAVDVALVA